MNGDESFSTWDALVITLVIALSVTFLKGFADFKSFLDYIGSLAPAMITFIGFIGLLAAGWYFAGYVMDKVKATDERVRAVFQRARQRRLARKKKDDYESHYMERLTEKPAANDDPLIAFWIESQQESNK